jgi:hypothetical protein
VINKHKERELIDKVEEGKKKRMIIDKNNLDSIVCVLKHFISLM